MTTKTRRSPSGARTRPLAASGTASAQQKLKMALITRCRVSQADQSAKHNERTGRARALDHLDRRGGRPPCDRVLIYATDQFQDPRVGVQLDEEMLKKKPGRPRHPAIIWWNRSCWRPRRCHRRGQDHGRLRKNARREPLAGEQLQRALLLGFRNNDSSPRRSERLAGQGHHDLYIMEPNYRPAKTGRGLQALLQGRISDGSTTSCQQQDYRPRISQAAREESAGGFVFDPGGPYGQPVSEAVRAAGAARADPALSGFTVGRGLDSRARRGRRRPVTRRGFWTPDLDIPASGAPSRI